MIRLAFRVASQGIYQPCIRNVHPLAPSQPSARRLQNRFFSSSFVRYGDENEHTESAQKAVTGPEKKHGKKHRGRPKLPARQTKKGSKALVAETGDTLRTPEHNNEPIVARGSHERLQQWEIVKNELEALRRLQFSDGNSTAKKESREGATVANNAKREEPFIRGKIPELSTVPDLKSLPGLSRPEQRLIMMELDFLRYKINIITSNRRLSVLKKPKSGLVSKVLSARKKLATHDATVPTLLTSSKSVLENVIGAGSVADDQSHQSPGTERRSDASYIHLSPAHKPLDECDGVEFQTVSSTQDYLIQKLKKAESERARKLIRTLLSELVESNILTPTGKSLLRAKLASSSEQLSSLEDPPPLKTLVRQAMLAGASLSQRTATIKDVMQGNAGKLSINTGADTIADRFKSPMFRNKEIESIDAESLTLEPYHTPQPPVATLAYGLERVLFNPGVYHLRDPRSRVFNFDPYLATIMPVADFDFSALKEYVTSSRDEALVKTALELKKKYAGSTSSMTSALAHFHYLISQWRPINADSVSRSFKSESKTFTITQRAPAAIFLRWRDGVYAIDADKQYDEPTVLSMLGKSMERMLTMPTNSFERYRKGRSSEITNEERNGPEAFHYSTLGDFLMRSQLDTYDPRLPGTGMFDLKTRAVVAIRLDARNYKEGMGYEIRERHGDFHSYEKEYFDMIRSAFLKYSLQVRMGRMEGIYVAFHNVERIFGFQYISLSEMDQAIHGSEDTTLGDREFKMSLDLMNKALDKATAKFPKQSLRIHFETRTSHKAPFLYVVANPVTEEEINIIQTNNQELFKGFDHKHMGLHENEAEDATDSETLKAEAEWEAIQAVVAEQIETEELIDAEESEIDALPEELGQVEKQSGEIVPSTRSPVVPSSGEEAEMSKSTVREPLGADIGSGLDPVEIHAEVELTAGDELSNITASTEPTKDYNQDFDPELQILADSVPEKPVAAVPADPAAPAKTSSTSRLSQDEVSRIGYPHADDDLLAMYVTVRNKVNDEYVTRPGDKEDEPLRASDKWTLEYAIATIPPRSKARSTYDAILARRKSIMYKPSKGKDQARNRGFDSLMKENVKLGREFRKIENEKDKMDGVKVFRDGIYNEPDFVNPLSEEGIRQRRENEAKEEAKAAQVASDEVKEEPDSSQNEDARDR